MINYQGNWDIPVDPDSGAAGDRGYGDEGLDHDTLSDEYQGDNDSNVEDGQHTDDNMADIDDGYSQSHLLDYDKNDTEENDFDEWRELGFDLGGEG